MKGLLRRDDDDDDDDDDDERQSQVSLLMCSCTFGKTVGVDEQ